MKDRAECRFTVKGKEFAGTREGVEKALEGVPPEGLRAHWVVMHGQRYPVRQAFAVAFGIERDDVRTGTALRVLRSLGFAVYTYRPRSATTPAEQRLRPRFPYAAWVPKTVETDRLDVRSIELHWSEWHRWEDVAKDDRGGGGVEVPEGASGVYEAKVEGQRERLVIGKAADLWVRLKQGLVRGHLRHEAGAKIRANEDLSRVRVRWAVTDRPAAAEEQLHQRHVKRFGRLPKYTEWT